MVYFVSDVHLGLQDRRLDKIREDLFIEFLRSLKHDCKVLYMLGDIFDYWFEYKTVIPAYFYRTLATIYELVKSGVEIKYLMGNHDFGHTDFFKNEFGIEVIKTDIECEIYNKKFYISHGDGKSYNDNTYLILKKILRNKYCQKAYSFLHPDCGITLALNTSRRSRNYTNKKNYSDRDGLVDFAFEKINEGFDYVVMGHRHKPEIRDFKTGKYVNLGDWLKNSYYAKFDGTSIKLLEFKI